MAEAIVSVVLEQLVSILRQQAESEVRLVVGVDEEIQTLTRKFRAIQAVLEDAENKRVKEKAVELWLEQLQDVSYDIDDLLDEWNTAIQKRELEKLGKDSSSNSKVCSLIPSSCCSPWQKVVHRRDIAIKIKELNKTLDNIAIEKERFNFSSAGGTSGLVRPITTSFSDEPILYGRDQDRDTILSLLSTGSCEELPFRVISVVGMGGLGKTALAREVFASVEENVHFDKKIWLCVSEPFDEIRIAKAILKSLDENSPDLVELENLLQKIYQLISGKRFLLVLDDVWTENPRNWEQLKGSLRCASHGSRILVTTRKEGVAISIGTSDMVQLGKLSNEECWSLFSQRAFSGRTSEECERFVDIGKLIVERCDGLPLAAKTLGSLLNTRTTIQQWQSVLNNDIWKLDTVEEQVFLPLLLSYFDLPSKLRKCFSYCVIFPKDCVLKKDVLIKLWMAQDYLRVEGREDMEVVGEEYFENLAKRSFFQDFERSDDDGSILRCKMHDIVHDFAQFLSKKECFIVDDHDDVEGQIHSSSKKIHHLRIRTDKIPICLYNKKELRSLILAYRTQANLSKLFDKLTCLRTLNLSDCNIEEIPRGIKKLMHLRYLNLSQNGGLTELHEAMCDLYNLQTLDINGCWRLKKLPKGMVKLINLRHLINDYTGHLRYMPRGMEKLINLRTLYKLVICSESQDNGAYSLDFLKNLNNPRGIFELEGLGNISEVKATELKSMKNLLDLRLSFDKQEDANGKRSTKKENQVILEALQPPPSLVELSISHYEGETMFPHWMVTLTNLTTLRLSYCMNCECLPPLGKLSALEYLKIYKMESVKTVDNEFLGIGNGGTIFPKLKTLEFENMEEWEEWNISKRGDENIAIMPCLQSLDISDCDKLKSLPDYVLQSTTLSELTVKSCSILISAKLGIPSYGGNTVFLNVTELTLFGAHNCESLPPLGNLSSLKSLTIKEMDNVKQVGNEFLGIESGSNINPSIIIFPNLKYLQFDCMRQWEEWQITTRSDESITIMPCLKTLYIGFCSKLKALPDQILRKPTLEFLTIRICPVLGRRYEREGEEWSKISHIPHALILSNENTPQHNTPERNTPEHNTPELNTPEHPFDYSESSSSSVVAHSEKDDNEGGEIDSKWNIHFFPADAF